MFSGSFQSPSIAAEDLAMSKKRHFSCYDEDNEFDSFGIENQRVILKRYRLQESIVEQSALVDGFDNSIDFEATNDSNAIEYTTGSNDYYPSSNSIDNDIQFPSALVIPAIPISKPTNKRFIHDYFPKLMHRRSSPDEEVANMTVSANEAQVDITNEHEVQVMDTVITCPCCVGVVREEFELALCFYCLRRCCVTTCSVKCHSCCESFCKICSTVNYDLPFERQMCLECNNS